jgi:hypothetical protein
MATEKKKSAPKKLTVKDLEGLKAGRMASGGTELSAEASDGTKTIKAVNQKTTSSFSQA